MTTFLIQLRAILFYVIGPLRVLSFSRTSEKTKDSVDSTTAINLQVYRILNNIERSIAITRLQITKNHRWKSTQKYSCHARNTTFYSHTSWNNIYQYKYTRTRQCAHVHSFTRARERAPKITKFNYIIQNAVWSKPVFLSIHIHIQVLPPLHRLVLSSFCFGLLNFLFAYTACIPVFARASCVFNWRTLYKRAFSSRLRALLLYIYIRMHTRPRQS